MKKKNYKLLLIGIAILFMSIFGIKGIYALSKNGILTRKYVDDMYYERTKTNYYHSHQYSTFDVSGKVAYCIEPVTNITEYEYVGSDDLIGASGLSDEEIRKILLYAYYGYEYPNHGTMEYRAATQTLIWEEVSDFKYEYHTKLNGKGDYIDLSDEIKEIENLIKNHDKKPSFNGITIDAVVGETVTLTDENNVLSNYEVYGNNIANVKISGNKLSFKVEKLGEIDLRFVKKQYLDEVALVYTSGDSQKLLTSGALDPVYFSFKVNTLLGKVSLKKIDADTGIGIPQGDASLSCAIYGIYKIDGTRVGELKTIENEYVVSDVWLKIGDYYLLEEQSSIGYELDNTKYYFEITKDDLYPQIEVVEKVIEKELKIFKVFASDQTGFLIGEPNVTFDIYLKSNGQKVTSITTDDQGFASTKLQYGIYVIKQKTGTQDHEFVKDFEVVIDENVENSIYKLLSNAEMKARLKVVKVDKETGNVIARGGIKFKIFDVNNNEYVCQTTNKVQCVFETNEDGILLTPLPLNSSTYRLEEVDQDIDGYLWNSQSKEFTIGENAELITDSTYGIIFEMQFENQPVKGNVEIYKTGEKIVFEDGTYYYEKINLDGVVFELIANEDIIFGGKKYYSKGELVATLITDENGYASLRDSLIPLGKYQLREIKSNHNNLINPTVYEFELSYKDQYTEVIYETFYLNNELPKGELEFTKTDFINDKALPNTKIEIYTENNVKIFEGYTNENGKIIIQNLPIGKFYILESEAPEGYILNDEKIWFEIKEDGEIVKANMFNEQVDVPNTLKNSNNILEIISVSFIIIGVGYIIYASRKK